MENNIKTNTKYQFNVNLLRVTYTRYGLCEHNERNGYIQRYMHVGTHMYAYKCMNTVSLYVSAESQNESV